MPPGLNSLPRAFRSLGLTHEGAKDLLLVLLLLLLIQWHLG